MKLKIRFENLPEREWLSAMCYTRDKWAGVDIEISFLFRINLQPIHETMATMLRQSRFLLWHFVRFYLSDYW